MALSNGSPASWTVAGMAHANEAALATMKMELQATDDSVKVSVCGRALEVSPESLSSVWLLRNELVGKLSVSGPASLQLADSSGTPIRIDEELSVAVRAGHYPLQVTLTDMALHEIENKKLEGENKKQEMSHLQW